jgi:protein-disulfide isomerase
VPEERQTKNQRREAAREAARLEREKQKRRDRLRRWLIPTVSTVAILAIAAAIVWAFVSNQPAAQSVAGPRNMISDGILFTADDSGAVVPVETGAIKPSGSPTPTDLEDDGLAHIVTYVDFSCPACQSFEATYAESIQSLVGSGLATLEVHPIAILDSRFAGSRYSSRSNNAGACVADLAPESFLDVMGAMFTNQPPEGTTGLTDAEITDIVHGAGLVNDDVDACIDDELFGPWVTAATDRTTSDADLIAPGAEGFSTPTIVVNGEVWDRTIDVMEFIQSHISESDPGTD